MFLLNDTIWDPFNTEYFIWLDASITNTVDLNHFKNNRVLDKIIPYLSDFLFLSYPYIGTDEIHGFNLKVMNRYAATMLNMFVEVVYLVVKRKSSIKPMPRITQH